jgi:hypothetical protein
VDTAAWSERNPSPWRVAPSTMTKGQRVSSIRGLVEEDMKRQLGRGVAVVGVGKSPFGMFADRDSKDLFAEAFSQTLAVG